MSDEQQVSKEWAKLFIAQLERHEKVLSDSTERCNKCREGLLERISEIKTRQQVLAVKVLMGAVILGLLADFGIRYLLK